MSFWSRAARVRAGIIRGYSRPRLLFDLPVPPSQDWSGRPPEPPLLLCGLVASTPGLLEDSEQQQPALDVRGHQEIFFYVFPAAGANAARKFRMCEQISDLKCAAFDRVHQNACQFVNDLVGDSTHGAGDRRL